MVFILSKNGRVINVLKNSGEALNTSPFFDDVLEEDLGTGAETFTFSIEGNRKINRDIEIGNYVAFKKGRKYKLFQIMSVEEKHEEDFVTTIYCECAGLELLNKVFRHQKMPSTTLQRFMQVALADTNWNVGFIEGGFNTSLDLDIETTNIYAAIQETVGQFGGEIEFRVEIENGGIARRYIDIFVNRGKVTGKRFEFAKDIEGIVRKVDSSELCTALVGVGRDNINFRDVQVSGIDKPIGQDYVADQASFEKYGKNGYHLMGVYEFDTKSPEELLRQTYKQLQKVKEKKVEYEVSVALLADITGESWNNINIGDTVSIVDNYFTPPIHLMARVVKLETSMTDPDSNSCTLANFIEVKSNITDEMRKLASKLEGYVDGSIENKFPIGGEDIQEGAIGSSHIYQNTISTDHLMAKCVSADKIKANSIEAQHVKAEQIETKHLKAGIIEAQHIKADQIDATHIKANSITADSGIIADATIGTAQIKDGEITVAKIQEAFVDNLVATQGKFQSAHIGTLTSNNIDTNTLKAEHITTSVIEAINMNVSGKINADRIDVGSLKVEELDAGKITSGYLNSDRIEAGSLTSDKIVVGTNSELVTVNEYDSNSIKNMLEDNLVIENFEGHRVLKKKNIASQYFMLSHLNKLKFEKDERIKASLDIYNHGNSSIELKFIIKGYGDNKQFILSAEKGKTLQSRVWTKIEEEIILGHENWDKVVYYTVGIENSANKEISVKKSSYKKKTGGDLIVNGSITTEKLDANAISADLIKSNVIQAINASIENATINAAKIGELNAEKITTGYLDARRIKAGSIEAEHINSKTITTIGINASEIVSNKITSGEIKVGNANIIDGTISGAKISSASISEAQISKATITDASIKSLNASKITAGTLDCGRLDVKNLKADSITTGSITVEGNNLLHNSNWKNDTSKWALSNGWRRDIEVLFEGQNTMKFDLAGITEDKWYHLRSERIPVIQGETYVLSAYFKSENVSIMAQGGIKLVADIFNSAGERIAFPDSTVPYSTATQGNWVRHTFSVKVEKAEAKTMALRVHTDRSGLYWVAKPMLSKGTIASVWKLHNDELISSGAIDNDKIANEAVSSSKLNVEELFVGDNAFISSLKAVEIDAASITTGKISSERIDISGLVSFEALNSDLKDNFQIVDGKTLINGGMIAADSIKANSIDLKGLTVKNQENDITFAIAKEGNITINAEIKTKNYNNDTNEGYILRTDGTAELNQVKIRGEIELPNAGMTNYGAVIGNENLATGTSGVFTMEGTNSTNQTRVIAGLQSSLVDGREATVSFNYEASEGVTGRLILQTGGNFYAAVSNPIMLEKNPKGESVYTLTFNLGEKTFSNIGVRLDNVVGTVRITNLKVEYGNKKTPWCPSTEENLNHVRIWSGSDFGNRNNAPFRVTQDGSLFASKGTFQGSVLGERVDIGKIHLHDNEIVINDTSRFIDNGGKLREITPYDYDNTAHLKLGKDFSFINTDFVLGSSGNRKLEYLKGANQLNVNDVAFSLKSTTTQLNSQLSSSYDKGIEFKSNINGNDGAVVMNFRGDDETESDWKNTFVIMKTGGSGSRYGDIFFRDRHWDNRITVGVRGSLQVTNSIKSEIQNIEMRSVSGEGWGFFAT